MNTVFETTSFLSSDGSNTISVKWWIPEEPKAVVQISHGMAEYAARYDSFARVLADAGFAVCADDHLGHGESVKSEEDWGYMGEQDGWKHMVEDLHILTGIAKERFPELPYVLFGHSMGSFMVRSYAGKWSDDIDALIVCGTGGPNPASGFGIKLASFLKKIQGGHRRSVLMNAIAFGSYNKKISNAKTPFDWLSVDEENVKKYIADPACGYLFTVCGFRDLMSVLDDASKTETVSRVRKDLPVLFIAGAEDPVGAYGSGVETVCGMFRNAGVSDCEIKIYSGARHEILNDICKNEVYADVVEWCRKRIAK